MSKQLYHPGERTTLFKNIDRSITIWADYHKIPLKTHQRKELANSIFTDHVAHYDAILVEMTKFVVKHH